jgi:uncharacterized protein
MLTADLLLLLALIFFAAMLYSSVGHGGASGYIAAMALFGIAPSVMRPTALVLNVLVASLGTYRLHRAGLVNWTALGRLSAASVPMAFIGGTVHLPGDWYRRLVGIVLLAAAVRLFTDPREMQPAHRAVTPPWAAALMTGGGIGLLSGLTGVGGGIFLSPFLVVFGWAGARQTSGITAPFILVNSVAGLAGNILSMRALPAELPRGGRGRRYPGDATRNSLVITQGASARSRGSVGGRRSEVCVRLTTNRRPTLVANKP